MRVLVTLFALALLVVVPAGAALEADTTAPDVLCGAADGIWHSADVSIACTASDSETGLANPSDASFDLTTSVAAGEETADALTDSRQVCDVATNCSDAGPIDGNQVDKKAPSVVSCAVPDGLWHLGNVTLSCQYTDGGSGPVTQDVSLSTTVAAGTETSNATASALGGQACDAVGNCAASPGDIAGNKIDRKASLNPTTVRSTDHKVQRWSRDRFIAMYWTGAADGGSGLDGFSYRWTQSSGSVPDQTKEKEQGAHTATSQRLSTGKWWFHIRTRDTVGNWSAAVHRGPYLVDVTRPQVRALSTSGKVGHTLRLKYRTADNTHKTRERITISRSGSVVSSWSKRIRSAYWGTIQYVSWSPHAAGSYSLCVSAFDPAGNTRRDCAGVSITKPAPPPSNCDPSYPTHCIPPPPPDLDCGDVPWTNFTVIGSDPHGFDGDGDGIGCET